MMDEVLGMLRKENLLAERDITNILTEDRKLMGDILLSCVISRSEMADFIKEKSRILFNVFNKWMLANKAIGNAIIWRGPVQGISNVNGTPLSYFDWSMSRKISLSDTFWKILFKVFRGLSSTPPYSLNLYSSGDVFATELSLSTAWSYYTAYVAQSLVIEIEETVPWSIKKYDKSILELLLDSKSLFEYSAVRGKYGIIRQHGILFNHGAATPGDPVRTGNFLVKNGFISSDRKKTVANVLSWCRDNLYHFVGGDEPQNYHDHWQYDGYPPVEKIISGTTHPQLGFGHFTAGCWGTTGFLRTLLRTVNIPVKLENKAWHALPHFAADDLYLSHGDDPYNWNVRSCVPQCPADELFIDQAKFDAWFNNSLSESQKEASIGRRNREIEVEYLPVILLKSYCDDLDNGKSHYNGDVYNSDLYLNYSVAELEAANLWNRMDAKIASMGGCAKIRQDYPDVP